MTAPLRAVHASARQSQSLERTSRQRRVGGEHYNYRDIHNYTFAT